MSETQEANRVKAGTDCVRLVLAASGLEPVANAKAGIPRRLLIVPWGMVESESGSFLCDDEAARLTLAAFAEHGADLPVDFEHQTLGGEYSSPSGQAPAAGWITGLSAVSPVEAGRPGQPVAPGLWADVTWTGIGAERLASREYRYVSPVALVRQSDLRIVGVHSVALTNKPAIAGMRPVVNQAPSPEDPKCGLDPADPTAAHLAALRVALSLDATSDAALVLRTAVGRLRAHQGAEAERAAADRVASAMAAGKLTRAQRDWAFALALRAPTEFDRWAEGAPVLVAAGRMSLPGRRPESGSSGPDRTTAAAARAEWRSNRVFLERLCSEDAYAAASVRGVVPG
ncbi:MAG: hypothetical protein KF841_11395 [Phycisphaerae bacterium]|nr:hypothetical protein [Phycisphaerae bacterium]